MGILLALILVTLLPVPILLFLDRAVAARAGFALTRGYLLLLGRGLVWCIALVWSAVLVGVPLAVAAVRQRRRLR